MYAGEMNGVELFLLGRTLMKLGEQAIPTEGLPQYSTSNRAVLIVASDILEHPNSSVGDIAERTSFAQSKVSACVARLREGGAIETTTDPADRRRLLVRPARRISERVARIRSTPITATLEAALGTDDPPRIAEITTALETLAEHLAPEAIARARSGTAHGPGGAPAGAG